MKRNFKNLLILFLVVAITFTSLGFGFAVPKKAYGEEIVDLSSALNRTVDFYRTKDSLDSWWELVALKGAGQNLKVGSWTLPAWNRDSLSDSSNVVDYSGYILGLLARGEDPANAWKDERNLVEELNGKQQEDGTFGSNTNDQIWAIIALDAAGSDFDREKAVSILIGQQKDSGGFAYSSEIDPDPDMTGMALSALVNYQTREDVQESIARAISYLKSTQQDNGGFSSWGNNNSNSLAAVISGLVAVGEDLFVGDWIKNGQTMLDALLSFQLEDGSFSYLADPKESNDFATRQSLIALGDLQNEEPVWKRLQSLVSPQEPVDKTVLESIITLARSVYEKAEIGSEPGQYPESAKTVLNQAITAAQEVLEKEDSIQDEVYQAVGTLKQAIAEFEAQAVSYPAKTVHLRVEGSNANIFAGEVKVILSSRPQTVIDALRLALEAKKIPYTEQGGYIRSINGEEAGKFGGWDGWMYLVNGAMAYSDQIKDGDQIVFYYGMFPPDTLIPTVSFDPEKPQPGEAFTVTVTSSYDVFNEKWEFEKTVNVNVEGAAAEFNGQTYLTDHNGQVTIPGTDLPGSLRVSKERENSYPALVRTGDIPVSLSMTEGVLDQNQTIEIEQATKITVPDGVNEAQFSVLPTPEGDKSVVILPLVLVEVNSTNSLNGMSITIPHGTKITAPADWNGKIGLPSELHKNSVSVRNGNVDAVIEIGLPAGGLIFDKPIRLVFPNRAGKSIGYINLQGQFQEITTILSEDSLAAATALPPGGDGKIDLGADLVVWTKHLTKFVFYTETTSGNGGGGSPVQKTIRLSVIGDKQKGSILTMAAVNLQDGDTAYSILKKTLGDRVEAAESGSSVYVRGIDGLREFDQGHLSGWVYFVNGASPGCSASSYVLQGGETVEWRYTVDGGKDLGLSSNLIFSPLKPVRIKITNEELVKLIEQISKQIINNENFSDWDVFTLMRAGQFIPKNYLADTEKLLKDKKGELRNITDYERMVIAVKAAGGDPSDVAGYNLIEKIYNHERMTLQGINGPAFALLALNSGDYLIPENAKWTKDKLIAWILEQQSSSGGFPLASGEEGDVDLTAMALTALSDYQEREQVKKTIEKGVKWLASMQLKNGGYKSLGEENSESVSQVIIALTSLGIDPRGSQFTKEEGDLLTNLLSFKKDDGSFCHLHGQSSDRIATQQALMALVAYNRFLEGKEKLYAWPEKIQLPDKEIQFVDGADISPWAVRFVQKTFQYKLMKGVNKTEIRFAPQDKMTRAQFATLLLRMLGEEPNTNAKQTFQDVKPDSWYYGYVMKMKEKGIIQGVDPYSFCPDQSIVRQDMAIMIARAFNLVALESKVDLKDIDLAYPQAVPYIRSVYANGVMVGDSGYFRPTDSVTREMAAVMAVKIYEGIIG